MPFQFQSQSQSQLRSETQKPNPFYWDLLYAGLFFALFFTWTYRDLFFNNTKAIQNDTAAWYGAFHYFVECILSGQLPYWNPYSHGGEPFYFLYSIFHLLDPTMLLPILIAKLFHPDLYRLYNGYIVFKEFFYCLGVLSLARYLFRDRFVFAITALLFLFIYKNDIGLPLKRDTLLWVPWILLCAYHAVLFPSRRSLLASGYLIGIFIGSGSHTSLYFLAFGFFLVLGAALVSFTHFKRYISANLTSICLAGGILLLLSLPYFAALWDRSKIFTVSEAFGAREFALEHFKAGTSYFPIDYLSNFIHTNYFSGLFLDPQLLPTSLIGSRTSLFALALFLALYGIFHTRFSLKNPLLLATLAMTSLALARTKIYYFLFHHLPFLQYLKHPIGFLYILEPLLMIFSGYALSEMLYQKWEGRRNSLLKNLSIVCVLPPLLSFFTIYLKFYWVALILWAVASVWLAPRPRKLLLLVIVGLLCFPSLNRITQQWQAILRSRTAIVSELNDIYSNLEKTQFRPRPITFGPKRQLALPRPGVLLFEPLLLKENVALTTILEPEAGGGAQEISFLKLIQNPVMSNRVPYWPTPYVDAYLIGEKNPGAFFDIMGVNKNLIRFYPLDSTRKLSLEQQKDLYRRFHYELTGDGSHTLKDSYSDHWLFLQDETNKKPIATNSMPTDAAILQPLRHEVLTFNTNQISLRLNSEIPGYLFYHDTFDTGWSATLDGKPTPIQRANLNFKAVAISAGTHHIAFQYYPTLFALSLYLYFISNLSMAAFALSLLLKSASDRAALHAFPERIAGVVK